MIGRTDKLETRQAVNHWKANGIDLSALLYQPEVPDSVGHRCQINQDHSLKNTLDQQILLERCKPALEQVEHVEIDLPIRNIHRVTGSTGRKRSTALWS